MFPNIFNYTLKFIFHKSLLFLLLFSGNLIGQPTEIEYLLEGVKVTELKSDGKNLWIATEGNGIFKYDQIKNTLVNYSSQTKKINQDFFYCIEVSDRFVWAGSADGLYIFDKKNNRWTSKKFSLGGQFGNWIRNLAYDKYSKKLWIGRFKFLTEFDLISNTYKDYNLTINKNEKTNSIKTLYIDGDSLLWIGAEAGIHKLKINKKNYSETDFQFFSNKRNYFLSEGDEVSITKVLAEQNYIWFGTDEFITDENPEFNLGGLFRYDRGIEWEKFSEQNNIKGSGIFSLELTGNYIWASLYKFDSKSKEQKGVGIVLINRNTLEVREVHLDNLPKSILCMHFDGKIMWLGSDDGLLKVNLTNSIIPKFK